MTLFPEWFDPSADTVQVVNLIALDTPGGMARFVLGDDLQFTCVDGHLWAGSQLLQMPESRSPLNGDAVVDEVIFSFFQDPGGPDLIAKIQQLGSDYVRGRALYEYLQPLQDEGERYAPTVAPIPMTVRTMLGLEFQLDGPLGRAIRLKVGSAFEGRASARALAYNTADHERLTGSANPSLEFVPTESPRNEQIFP